MASLTALRFLSSKGAAMLVRHLVGLDCAVFAQVHAPVKRPPSVKGTLV